MIGMEEDKAAAEEVSLFVTVMTGGPSMIGMEEDKVAAEEELSLCVTVAEVLGLDFLLSRSSSSVECSLLLPAGSMCRGLLALTNG